MARPARGHHQRARDLLALNAPPPAPVTSKLGSRLKKGFCWGKYSAAEVQLLANDAVEDHQGSPQELLALAALGSHGRFPNHCHEELLSLLRREFPGLPEPRSFPLHLRRSKLVAGEQVESEVSHSIYHPWELASYWYNHKPQWFARKFLGVKKRYKMTHKAMKTNKSNRIKNNNK